MAFGPCMMFEGHVPGLISLGSIDDYAEPLAESPSIVIFMLAL